MKAKTLFAIYKNEVHKGNVRAKSISDAISNYIIDSGISRTFLSDSKFLTQYRAEKSIKGLHHN
jgi:hypothetical protein